VRSATQGLQPLQSQIQHRVRASLCTARCQMRSRPWMQTRAPLPEMLGPASGSSRELCQQTGGLLKRAFMLSVSLQLEDQLLFQSEATLRR